MKKTIFSIMLVLALIVSLTAGAFAASPESENGYIVNQGEPIGTFADQDGIDVAPNYSRRAGLPFDMTAAAVSNLLTTYSSGKSFTGGEFDGLTGEGLLIEGTLTHSGGSAYTIKAGACYYRASNDTFYSVSSHYFPSGVADSTFIKKVDGGYINFNNTETYYGYINNHNNVGQVTGTLTFSRATA